MTTLSKQNKGNERQGGCLIFINTATEFPQQQVKQLQILMRMNKNKNLILKFNKNNDTMRIIIMQLE
jgi:hypothetical protein